MERRHYNTQQREKIMDFLISKAGEHVTASDVCNYLVENNSNVGTTTVYRHLDRLVKEGLVKKYTIDSTSAACFEYIEEFGDCLRKGCTHLKCTNCGKLIHLHCDNMRTIEKHIYEEHGFKVDMSRTVFYGLCEECQ